MEKTKEEILAWLVRELASQLRMDASEIDPTTPVLQYGADSLIMVTLGGDLEVWLDRPLSPTLMWQYPTLESLAAYLAASSGKGS